MPSVKSGNDLSQFNKLLNRVKRHGQLALLFRKEVGIETVDSMALSSPSLVQKLPQAFVTQAPRINLMEEDRARAASLDDDVSSSSLPERQTLDKTEVTLSRSEHRNLPSSDDEKLLTISEWHRRKNRVDVDSVTDLAGKQQEDSDSLTPSPEKSISVEPTLIDTQKISRKVMSDDEKLQAIYDWHKNESRMIVTRPSDDISSTDTESEIKRKGNFRSDIERPSSFPPTVDTPQPDNKPAHPKTAQEHLSSPEPKQRSKRSEAENPINRPHPERPADDTQSENTVKMIEPKDEDSNYLISRIATEAPSQDDQIPKQPKPLQEAWPVEISGPSHDTQPMKPISRKSSVKSEKNEVWIDAVKEVPPAKPTSSPVEIQAPRRPRPQHKIDRKPAEQKTVDQEVTASLQTAPPITESQTEVSFVETEVGPLPADLWDLIGEKPSQTEQSEKVLRKPYELDSTENKTESKQTSSKIDVDTSHIQAERDESFSNTFDPQVEEVPIVDSGSPLMDSVDLQSSEILSAEVYEPATPLPAVNEDEESPRHIIDTDQIAELVLEDILKRYALELERFIDQS